MMDQVMMIYEVFFGINFISLVIKFRTQSVANLR
jgi:hypothetical protein